MSICWPQTYPPNFSERDHTYKIWIETTVPYFRAFKVWDHLSKKASNKNYHLIICKDHGFPSFSIIINRKAFYHVVKENKDLFTSYYGKDISAEEIISRLHNKKYQELFKEPLFQAPVLLGIGLGYGRHAAQLFHRKAELCGLLFSLVMPQPEGSFTTTEQELRHLNKLTQTNKRDWLMHIDPLLLKQAPVSFIYDDTDLETRRLIKEYHNTYVKLIDIFGRNDWLDIILSKLFLEEIIPL